MTTRLVPLGTRKRLGPVGLLVGDAPPPLPDLEILVALYGHNDRRAEAVAHTFANWNRCQSPMPRVICAWCYREGKEPVALASVHMYPWLELVRLPEYDIEDQVFRKEGLLNYLLRDHSSAPYILTLDTDVWTEDRQWFRRVRDRLSEHPDHVFQPWTWFRDTAEDMTAYSVCARMVERGRAMACHHPGLGWAFTRAWAQRHPDMAVLNPLCVTGCGDWMFVREHFASICGNGYFSSERIPKVLQRAIRDVPQGSMAGLDVDVWHVNHTDRAVVPADFRAGKFCDRAYHWSRISLDQWGGMDQYLCLDWRGVPMLRDPGGPFAQFLARKPEMQTAADTNAIIAEVMEVAQPRVPWSTIEGWFSAEDAKVNTMLAESCRPDGTIVALGIWKGRSTAHLCQELDRLGKTGVRVVAVDRFGGGLLATAKANLAWYPSIRFVCGDTAQAASQFPDGTVDGVFFDACHEHVRISAEIDAWLPKIRPGGIAAGHDYCRDWPGVMEAVVERFAGRFAVCDHSWHARLPDDRQPGARYRITLETLPGIGDHLMLCGVVRHIHRQHPDTEISIHLTKPGLEPWFRLACPTVQFTDRTGFAIEWRWLTAPEGKPLVALYGATEADIVLPRPEPRPRATVPRIAFVGAPNSHLPLKTWPHWDRLADLVRNRYGVDPIRVGTDVVANPVSDLSELLGSMDLVVCTEGMASHICWAIRQRAIVLVSGAIDPAALAYPGWHTILRTDCPHGRDCHHYTTSSKAPMCQAECMASLHPESVLAAMADHAVPRIVNLHYLTDNCGDANCGVARYFPGIAERSTNADPIPSDVAIFGGGGLYHRHVYELAKRYRELGAKIVIWGAGIVTEDRAQGMTPWTWREFGDLADLCGLREPSPWEFVPCPSCMSPLFDTLRDIEPTHDVVYYNHPAKPVRIGEPRMTNYQTTDLETVFRFLASGRRVVTSSYHGRIWATWLGRDVELDGPAAEQLAQSGSVPSLAEARQINRGFWASVQALQPERTLPATVLQTICTTQGDAMR